jgi:two-component system invasion response regulator UvrY
MLVAPTSVQDIARALHLSVKTVHNLHYQIKAKLAVDGDIELTRLALSWGLDLPPAGVRAPAWQIAAPAAIA